MTLNEETARVVERIKKMMALANDPAAAEGERENAMRMAHKTLAKYNLSIAELAEPADDRRIINSSMSGHFWARVIANAVANLFFCENYSMRDFKSPSKVRQYFVGREANALTASSMADYIIKSVAREARNRRNDGRHNSSWERSFCKGAAHRIYHRCHQLRKEEERAQQPASSTSTALVLASVYQQEEDRNKALMAQQGIEVKVSRSQERNTDWQGSSAGDAYGNKVNLSRQLGDSSGDNRKRLS